MKLIIGLGNPGAEYINTRHNVGYMVIDHYADASKWQSKWNALYTEKFINGEKILLVKPTTYMNLSGQAVQEFVNFYKIPLTDILVIQDDLDLNFGIYKLKTNSSAGGHNGIKSIINCLGSNNFARLKIGITKNKTIDTKAYVLSKFNNEEIKELEDLYPIFNDIITSFITNGLAKTMNKYNQKNINTH